VGSDLIIAGNGKDLLLGGAGADTFKFLSSTAAGGSPSTCDTIRDFTHGSDDIDVSAFMAGGRFIGAAGFDAHVVKAVNYVAATGVISGDVDGNGTVDWTLLIKAQTVLTAADFIF
jgi:serralysin